MESINLVYQAGNINFNRTVKKKLYVDRSNLPNNPKYHHNISSEFKDLGYLSKEKRDLDYHEQDNKFDFAAKPTIYFKKSLAKPRQLSVLPNRRPDNFTPIKPKAKLAEI